MRALSHKYLGFVFDHSIVNRPWVSELGLCRLTIDELRYELQIQKLLKEDCLVPVNEQANYHLFCVR